MNIRAMASPVPCPEMKHSMMTCTSGLAWAQDTSKGPALNNSSITVLEPWAVEKNRLVCLLLYTPTASERHIPQVLRVVGNEGLLLRSMNISRKFVETDPGFPMDGSPIQHFTKTKYDS